MAQKPSRETYFSLNEITSQYSLTPTQSTSYDPLHQDDHDGCPPDQQQKTWFRMKKSWKSTVALGVVTAGLVLLINLSFFIYMVKLEGFQIASVTTVFTGM